MASYRTWTCDGCGTAEHSDRMPTGWHDTRVRVDGGNTSYDPQMTRAEAVYYVYYRGDLCGACRENLKSMANPKNWTRRPIPDDRSGDLSERGEVAALAEKDAEIARLRELIKPVSKTTNIDPNDITPLGSLAIMPKGEPT